MHSRSKCSALAALLATSFLTSSPEAQTGEMVSHLRIETGQAGFQGPSGPSFGSAVASVGDLDGDGIGDLAVGDSQAEAIWILFLRTDGTVRGEREITDGAGGFTAEPGVPNAGFGSSLTSLGDLDGDGTLELAVGADGIDQGRGGLWILSIDSLGIVNRQQLISPGRGGLNTTMSSQALFGAAVAKIGDLDGDGIPEVAVGAPEYMSWGFVMVLFLNADSTVRKHLRMTQSAGGVVTGSLMFSGRFGASVAGIGDRNGDGYPDIAVGAPYENVTGAVRILYLGRSGNSIGMKVITGPSPGMAQPGIHFGSSLAALGDLDGNGATDLAVGQSETAPREPEVWNLFLDGTGNPIGSQRLALYSVLQNAQPSSPALTSLGDLDSDGREELAVGTDFEQAVHVIELGNSGFLPPVASIGYDITALSPGNEIFLQLRDQTSNNVNTWSWDLHTGIPSFQPDPASSYGIPSTAPIVIDLTVSGRGGSSSTQLILDVSPALSQPINGMGGNPMCFTASEPKVGSPWVSSVDTSAHPSATAVFMLLYAAPSSGTFLPGGELLVDLSSQRFMSRFRSAGVPGLHNLTSGPIPLDLSLVGMTATAQGAIDTPSGPVLCNGTSLTVGF